MLLFLHGGFPGGSVVKISPANAGEAGDRTSIPGSGRPPGGGNGNPLQYSCLGNPMGRETWWATILRVTKNWTRLSMHANLPSSLIYSTYTTVVICQIDQMKKFKNDGVLAHI